MTLAGNSRTWVNNRGWWHGSRVDGGSSGSGRCHYRSFATTGRLRCTAGIRLTGARIVSTAAAVAARVASVVAAAIPVTTKLAAPKATEKLVKKTAAFLRTWVTAAVARIFAGTNRATSAAIAAIRSASVTATVVIATVVTATVVTAAQVASQVAIEELGQQATALFLATRIARITRITRITNVAIRGAASRCFAATCRFTRRTGCQFACRFAR